MQVPVCVTDSTSNRCQIMNVKSSNTKPHRLKAQKLVTRKKSRIVSFTPACMRCKIFCPIHSNNLAWQEQEVPLNSSKTKSTNKYLGKVRMHQTCLKISCFSRKLEEGNKVTCSASPENRKPHKLYMSISRL